MTDLSGKKVAIVVDNYFEQVEFTGPRDALAEAGATIEVISDNRELTGLHHVAQGDSFQADKLWSDGVSPRGYAAVVLPGGAINADQLRMNQEAYEFVRAMYDARKPVAAICHAPWILISNGIARGRRLTSFFTIQDDLRNAGADWIDKEVVVDGNLITSRKPDDIPTFNNAIMRAMA